MDVAVVPRTRIRANARPGGRSRETSGNTSHAKGFLGVTASLSPRGRPRTNRQPARGGGAVLPPRGRNPAHRLRNPDPQEATSE